MTKHLNLYYIQTQHEFDFFWKMRDAYLKHDVFQHDTLGIDLTDEEINYFYSDAYKKHLMKLYHRDIDPLHVVFFQNNKEYYGFIVYVTYYSEDSKCFIIDYCIDPSKRNQNFGSLFFQLFVDKLIQDKANYFALNLSNENNLRFWSSHNFIPSVPDEYGNMIYVKKIIL